MTEVWKSTPKYFCEYCKVWMQDNQHSRMMHEQGVKHKEAVARKLSDMRRKADSQKREAEEAAATMARIEASAERQYREDMQAAAELKRQTLGEWVINAEAGYYYNAVQRYYYDTKTGQYYGGDPAGWTKDPAIPREARYEVMTKPLPPPAHPPPASTLAQASATRPPQPSGGPARTAATAAAAAPRAGMRVAARQHPLAEVGGYQMPEVGRIGGAKGVGSAAAGGSGPQQGGADPGKRKRETASGKSLSKEELEAQARREAARQRVQQRTMASFGLQ